MYLLENNLIEGYHMKNKLIMIFLKYTITKKPTIREASVISKNIGFRNKIINKNFAIN